MRILCLTSRLPFPPDRGDRLRAYNFIRRLSRDHDLTLVSFIADNAEQANVADLQEICQAVHVVHRDARRSALAALLNAWRRQPLQALYYRSAAMQRLIDRVRAGGQFDAVYVHLFRMAPYVAGVEGVYRIVDLTDVISVEIGRSMPYRGLASRLLYAAERPRIARFERQVAQQFEEVWLISEADRRILAGQCPAANIRVVTNGVDAARFYPTGQARYPRSLVFVGHLRVFHNVDAVTHLARDILPLVRAQVPDCTLTIVGADPAPEVHRLAADPAVTVTGFVPDLNQYLNQAALFVAPLRFAAGVQNKVLEAMATATPVVTTTLVNDGLGASAGEELIVADGAAATARQVVALLGDPSLASRIGQAGLAFVQRAYSWDRVAQRVSAIEDSLAPEALAA